MEGSITKEGLTNAGGLKLVAKRKESSQDMERQITGDKQKVRPK
jgi:hypothetical protein